MQAAEIELKFPVVNMEKLRGAATTLGLRILTERTFESNTLYDTPERTLRTRKQILRVRQYGNLWTVTHKRRSDAADLRYKTRIETESIVADGPALAEIFTQLGYAPVFRYEKYRTEWEGDEGHLVLDETPIGIYAELEGPTEWIDRMLLGLGVPQDTLLTDSYGKLFERWKAENKSCAENLTFDEIAAIPA